MAAASFGGYLATWLLGHTDVFKTLVNQAGASDFFGQYGADLTNYIFDDVVWGGHGVAQCGSLAAQQPHQLREQLQDADADPAW